MGPMYATREDVKSALDAAETALSNAQVDRLIDAASRSVEALTHRRFYPELSTRTFAWPNTQMGVSWRLWLDANELISITSLQSGGVEIADYFLEPQSSGPPYNRVEIDLAGPGAFAAGSTEQRAVSITGLFGYGADTRTGGRLDAAIGTTDTTIAITDSAAIGIGDLLLIDDERLQVTGRRMRVTGQTLQASLTASKNDTAVQVSDATGFTVGEVLLLDTERVLVVDIAGGVLVVRRAQDGSVLEAHDEDASVYASRTLTVERATLGTTAATHTIGTSIAVHTVPAPVRALVIAETLAALQSEQGAYTRGVGRGDRVVPGDRTALQTLRDQVYASHGRKARKRAV